MLTVKKYLPSMARYLFVYPNSIPKYCTVIVLDMCSNQVHVGIHVPDTPPWQHAWTSHQGLRNSEMCILVHYMFPHCPIYILFPT